MYNVFKNYRKIIFRVHGEKKTTCLKVPTVYKNTKRNLNTSYQVSIIMIGPMIPSNLTLNLISIKIK